MSGWIKLEKDLETDRRVQRIVKRLDVTGVTHDRITHERHVTQVIGALARLWFYGDSHIREDDSIEMTAEELDELVGIPGFAAAMPPEWLRIREDGTLELPNFQEHNGPEAKSRAQTQRRVARHRTNNRKRTSVTPSNGAALPDQTRPDQTRQDVHASRVERAREPQNDRHAFERIKAAYPAFSGRQDWIHAQAACHCRIDQDGATWAELLGATERYAAYVAAGGVSGPQYVLTPAKFFGAPDDPWKQPWTPPPTKAERRTRANLEAAAQAKEELFGGTS